MYTFVPTGTWSYSHSMSSSRRRTQPCVAAMPIDSLYGVPCSRKPSPRIEAVLAELAFDFAILRAHRRHVELVVEDDVLVGRQVAE